MKSTSTEEVSIHAVSAGSSLGVSAASATDAGTSERASSGIRRVIGRLLFLGRCSLIEFFARPKAYRTERQAARGLQAARGGISPAWKPNDPRERSANQCSKV